MTGLTTDSQILLPSPTPHISSYWQFAAQELVASLITHTTNVSIAMYFVFPSIPVFTIITVIDSKWTGD